MLPRPHINQVAILQKAKRYNVLACGRRFGKSQLGVILNGDKETLKYPVGWFAPQYKDTTEIWRDVSSIFAPITVRKSAQDYRLELVTGGVIEFWSLDNPDAGRGRKYKRVLFDEAAKARNLQEAWEQAVRPTLTDYKGDAWFFSTPKGFNYFYEMFRREDSEPELWQSVQMPTSMNPYIDPSEIEAARRELPALIFRQEFLAEFVQLHGAMFRREWLPVIDAVPNIKVAARGWDLAASQKSGADYTVGAKVGFTPDGGLVVLDVVRGRWEWPESLRIIASTAKSDGPHVVQAIEDNGQQKAMLQLIRREQSLVGLPFRGVSEILHKPMGDKVARANIWLPRAEQGKMSLMRGNWNNQFLDVVCSFPEGAHDDDVDAVSAAMIALTQTNRSGRGT